jgi:hypothetical protein
MCISVHICDECILALYKITIVQAGFMFMPLLPCPIFGATSHMTELHEIMMHESESRFVVESSASGLKGELQS